MIQPSSASGPLSPLWAAIVLPHLLPQERIVAVLDLDLTPRLKFEPGLLVLTPTRLLTFRGDPNAETPPRAKWEWPTLSVPKAALDLPNVLVNPTASGSSVDKKRGPDDASDAPSSVSSSSRRTPSESGSASAKNAPSSAAKPEVPAENAAKPAAPASDVDAASTSRGPAETPAKEKEAAATGSSSGDTGSSAKPNEKMPVPVGSTVVEVRAPEGETLAAPPTPSGLMGEWPVAPELTLKVSQLGSVGQMDLADADNRVACWRFTAGRVAAAQKLVRLYQAVVRGDELEEEEADAKPAEDSESSEAPARSLFRLVRFAKPHAALVALGFGLTLASTAASLVPPYLTMPLLDEVLIPMQNGKHISFGLVWLYVAGLGLAAVLAWMLSWARTYVLSWVSENIAAELRNQTYAHLQKLSLEFFGTKRTGDLMSRVGSDTDRINIFLSVNALDFVTDVLMILMTSLILIRINYQLALVTLIPFPFIAWMIQQARNKLRRGFDRGNRAWAEMISVLADTIPGIRVVKAFAQEQREIDRFRRGNDMVLEANDQVNRVWAFFGPMVTLLTEAGLLIIWAAGAYLVLNAQITVGVLTAFVAYITRFYARLESMSRLLAALQRAAAATDRVFDILDREPKVPEPVHPVHPGRLKGRIELRNATFRHGNRSVVRGLNLEVEPGEMIGVVGPSGGGKSTLVNLVCRFYDVNDGAVLVDDVDVRKFPISEYRANIGLVLQEPFLFYGTVAENIAYGKPNAPRAEIVAAARAAGAHEFILKLPEGYDSMVGERGQTLSGGERQRISIARALLIDPRILILDEATSAVDTETEREIQAALENLIQGRTTLAVAHRLSTLRRADRIVVIENGEITEVGPHDELLRMGGTYCRLHHAQLERGEQESHRKAS